MIKRAIQAKKLGQKAALYKLVYMLDRFWPPHFNHITCSEHATLLLCIRVNSFWGCFV